jgi:hypothetical protein
MKKEKSHVRINHIIYVMRIYNLILNKNNIYFYAQMFTSKHTCVIPFFLVPYNKG